MELKKKLYATLTILVFSAGLSSKILAAAIVLDATSQCSQSNATTISKTDVTGDLGGATDCWGAFTGNDPGPSGDGFSINGQIFDYVAKQNTPGALEGASIGLTVSPSGGALSGSWAFTQGAINNDFLIVLKAANSPGYGVWLFSGADNASYSGNWSVAWNKNLSHLSVYESTTSIPPLPAAAPAIFPVYLLGLLGLGLLAKVRRKG